MPARRRSTEVGLDSQLSDPRLRARSPRKVLVVGEIAPSLRAELSDRGASLVEFPELMGVFELLARDAFDVIVVDPFVAGGGLDFVNALKEDAVEHERTKATLYGARGNSPFLRGVAPPALETLVLARARHGLTPVIVLPMRDSPNYAIVVQPPKASVLRNMNRLPVATAIMTVRASDFFGSTGALA